VLRVNELEPGLIPAGLAVLVFVLLGVKDAGYPATVWYPSTIFVLLLLALTAWAGRRTLAGLPRLVLASILSLALLTAWTYLSIAWSEVKGDALDGANRMLLYLAVYLLFLLLAPAAGAVLSLLAVYVLAVFASGLWEFVAASRATDPDAYFLLARFSEPTGYQNANSALFSLAFWPALFIASRRELPVLVRALMLGAAGGLVELALLSQSRGWLAAMPLVFLLYIALVPGRVRSLVFMVPVAAAVLAARAPLLDVYSSLRDGSGISSALDGAVVTVVLSALALCFVGAVMALIDRRLLPAGAVARRLTLATGSVFALAAVVGLVAGLVWLGNPATRARHAWHGFKSTSDVQGSYLTSGFSSNRYDLWRVAWHEFKRSPVKGVGSDQFAVDYVRERHSPEEPLYPHSVELKVLAQTGIVGAILLVAFLATAVAAWAGRRAETQLARATRTMAFVGFAYWFLHGSVDWFWELAGLGAPAFALLAVAVGDSARDATPRRAVRHSAALAVAALIAAAVLVPPWLSALEVRAAAGQWRKEPDQALDRLHRARSLNPLSDWPDVIAGAIASRVGNQPEMVTAFRRGIARNPSNWYSHLELAVAYGRAGQRSAALRELGEVKRLNPREPTIPLVRDGLRSGRPISTAQLDTIFLRRTFVSNRVRPR